MTWSPIGLRAYEGALRARARLKAPRSDQRARACVTERIMVLERDAQVRRHAREIVSIKPREGASRHRDCASKSKGELSVECALDL